MNGVANGTLPREPFWVRWQGWWPGAVLFVVAGASAWVLAELNRERNAPEGEPARVPDFYLNEFETVNHDEQGRLERRLRARHLAHFPESGASELEAPSVTLYQPDATPWRVESEHGWLSESGQVLLLLGEVHIWRNNAAGQRIMDVVTQDLRVMPEADYAETDEPVVITTPHSRTTGVGLRIYLKLGRMELLSDVKSTYLRNAYVDYAD
ncbi:MAG: LPS export ABC transporter periplasmic protein LptC [Gammaproteobacteria bacterium]